MQRKKRKRNEFVILIFLIVFSYQVSAASVTAAATFEVKNVLPVVNLAFFEDEDFEDERGSFSLNENGYLRIEVIDLNGYADVQKVQVKFVGIDNREEINITGYEDYIDAEFVSGVAGTAIFRHEFTVNEGHEDYRFYVKVTDKQDEITSSIDFNEEFENQITGAIVARPTRSVVLNFFRNLFSRIFAIF